MENTQPETKEIKLVRRACMIGYVGLRNTGELMGAISRIEVARVWLKDPNDVREEEEACKKIFSVPGGEKAYVVKEERIYPESADQTGKQVC